MKNLLFPFLLVFSASVFAKTYYCTQFGNSSIYFNKEENMLSENETTDDIFKVVIDVKNEVLKLRVLDNSSATFWGLYDIINQSDDKDRLVIIATKSVVRKSYISSLILIDSKKNNEVELLQNTMRQYLGSNTFRFKCSRE